MVLLALAGTTAGDNDIEVAGGFSKPVRDHITLIGPNAQVGDLCAGATASLDPIGAMSAGAYSPEYDPCRVATYVAAGFLVVWW